MSRSIIISKNNKRSKSLRNKSKSLRNKSKSLRNRSKSLRNRNNKKTKKNKIIQVGGDSNLFKSIIEMQSNLRCEDEIRKYYFKIIQAINSLKQETLPSETGYYINRMGTQNSAGKIINYLNVFFEKKPKPKTVAEIKVEFKKYPKNLKKNDKYLIKILNSIVPLIENIFNEKEYNNEYLNEIKSLNLLKLNDGSEDHIKIEKKKCDVIKKEIYCINGKYKIYQKDVEVYKKKRLYLFDASPTDPGSGSPTDSDLETLMVNIEDNDYKNAIINLLDEFIKKKLSKYRYEEEKTYSVERIPFKNNEDGANLIYTRVSPHGTDITTSVKHSEFTFYFESMPEELKEFDKYLNFNSGCKYIDFFYDCNLKRNTDEANSY